MTYWLLVGATTLSAFALAAVLSSLAVASAGPIVTRHVHGYSPASRALFLFQMRVLPAAVATVAAFGVALPVFVRYERHDTDEVIARTLLVTAAFGAALIGRGVARAFASWRATHAVMQAWRRRGRALADMTAPIPVYAIDESFPTVAVVGCLRPVLFISERVLRECNADEVRAIVSHECAHVTARDNVKRFFVRACPDVLPSGTAVERAWRIAVEEAADASAATANPACAADLAQALIRVARLAPMSAPALASTFYSDGSIESRVRLLVELPTAPDLARPFGRVMIGGLGAAFAFAVVLAAPTLHQVMEAAVRLLP
jgi:hypothetical protein